MSRGFASNYRIVLIATGLFACFAALGTRLVFLHVTHREDLLRTIVKTRRQLTMDTARRGEIYDLHGAILATSQPLKVIAVDPMMVRLGFVALTLLTGPMMIFFYVLTGLLAPRQ